MSTPFTNRLANEPSLYLKQHAHNPVDWYPWSEEALEKARQEDKLIIVSVGYSACHWCHVMERECFEDEAVAQQMNEHFVSIKVDREERPDVDQIYMEAVQMMGLQGGWPLNVFLTPDQKPFYGGTYFPKEQWTQLLSNTAQAYQNNREELITSAEQFAQGLARPDTERYEMGSNNASFDPEQALRELPDIYRSFAKNFDTERGGMAKAPKFPMPSQWLFLMRYCSMAELERTEEEVPDEGALQQLKLTVDRMANGGIYDQVGGGFARYSVDADWFAPHFEKMLYDNGQLMSVYAEAHALTQGVLYRRVVYEMFHFVRRELTSDEGGFYSALDADSEGEEGKFYTWTYDELKDALGYEADLVIDYFEATEAGNWENGRNILHKSESNNTFAQRYDLNMVALDGLIADVKVKLREIRDQRVRPGLDDKIIASWNGLMLKGLADAYAITRIEDILKLALQNAQFIVDKLTYTSGETRALYRTYQEGEARLNGYLDDYAFVIDALLGVYQVTFDEQWLEPVRQLTDHVMQHFWDEEEGFFFYTDDSSQLIARKKEIFDNVIPSSNSAMARNLHRLGLLFDRADYSARAEAMLVKVIPLIKTDPSYLSNWACLYTEMATPTAEIAVVGPDAHATMLELNQQYYPNKLLVGTTTSSELPLLQNRDNEGDDVTIYVCYNKTCQLPATTTHEAWDQLMIG
ncbi:MAG: thioredoxin domain-containing protein [Tunicatimonas sp.]